MKRDNILDVAKGIGIILVILAHITQSKVKTFIYIFHMPLFFFISGMALYYSYKEEIFFKDYIKKELKQY